MAMRAFPQTMSALRHGSKVRVAVGRGVGGRAMGACNNPAQPWALAVVPSNSLYRDTGGAMNGSEAERWGFYLEETRHSDAHAIAKSLGGGPIRCDAEGVHPSRVD